LGTAHNLKDMRSELVIVNALTMQECARVILPFRNAFQVHGVWASLSRICHWCDDSQHTQRGDPHDRSYGHCCHL